MNNNYQSLSKYIKKLFKREVKILILRPELDPTDPSIINVSKELESKRICIGNIENWAKGKYHILELDETTPFKARIYKKKNNQYVFELIESSKECLISRKGLLDKLISIREGETINLRSNTTIFFGDPQSNKRVELTFSNPLTITETISIGIVSLMSLIMLSLLILCLLVAYEIPRVPAFLLPQSIEILSNDNEKLLTIVEKGSIKPSKLFVPLKETGIYLAKAVITSEDRFFENNNFGVDGLGILRALLSNLWASLKNWRFTTVQGASTIHQQVVSGFEILPETYISRSDFHPYRKIREIAAAIKLAQTVSSDKVLEIYINGVHLGNGKDGFQSASSYYFGQPIKNLSLAKVAALVAAIPKPCRYNLNLEEYINEIGERIPIKECPKLSKQVVTEDMNEGKDVIIDAMVDSRYINQQEAKKAKQEKISESELSLPKPQSALGIQISNIIYFRSRINDVIKQSKAPHLIVSITLDSKKQAASDKVLQDAVDTKGSGYNFEQGAIVTLDPSTGEVLAITEGLDKNSLNEFNRATIAERASGSTFKIFDYLAALENNISPYKYFDCSSKSGVRGCRSGTKNMNMFEGFARSENVIAIRVAESAGLENVVKLAKSLGVNTTTAGDPANLFLGGQNTKVIDMAMAYAAVINRGTYYSIPKTIVSAQECNNLQDEKSCQPITFANQPQSSPRQVVKPENADLMVSMMRGVVEVGGTGTLADIPYKYVVGKTGTTDNARDLWFIGALPKENLLVAVWIGNDQGDTDVGNSGGEIAAQVWKDYMLMIEKS